MSKLIFACSRNRSFSDRTSDRLTEICNALVPDNVNEHPSHRIRVRSDLAYGVSLSNGALHESDMSLLLGFLFEERRVNWWEPRTEVPDGNFALFRVNDDVVEVLSDCAGTRTIWYFHDDDLFVASTSQRAIIMYLEEFTFDERTIPWIFSTGSLGPQFSWDKRLKRVQAKTSLLLNRETWTLTILQRSTAFSEAGRSPEEHKELLAKTIATTMNALGSLDFKRWMFPLSGGYDSRAILCFVINGLGVPDDLKAVTWGLAESINEEGNDAKVARDVARALGVQHEYYHTDVSSEPIDKVVDRFVLCSEGRIDRIAGYMDGMDIWRRFCEGGITGVVRGDEGFGWIPVSSELTVRLSVSCGMCTDFKNLAPLIDKFGLAAQEFPPDLERRAGETLEAWRDRLYHSFRLPSVLAALSDIKFSYVEQVNPLLSEAIMEVVRSIPDSLRTDKALFKSVVDSIGPAVSIARSGANASPKNILRDESFTFLLRSELNSEDAINLFGSTLVKWICAGMEEAKPIPLGHKLGLKQLIKAMLPRSLKNSLPDTLLRPVVDGNQLAFRAFLVSRVFKLLKTDARRLSGKQGTTPCGHSASL